MIRYAVVHHGKNGDCKEAAGDYACNQMLFILASSTLWHDNNAFVHSIHSVDSNVLFGHRLNDTFFCKVVNIDRLLYVEDFSYGNVDCKYADEAAGINCEALTHYHGRPTKKKIATKLVIKRKHTIDHHQMLAPNGTDDNSSQVIQYCILVDLMGPILDEPLHNQIRTKEVFGYEV